MDDTVIAIIVIAVILLLCVLPYVIFIVVGSSIEKKMLQQVESDEKQLEHIKIIDVKRIPQNYLGDGCRTQMVCGCITVAGNWWRNFCSQWRNVFGGSMKSYGDLVVTARRAAMVRMKREAEKLHADCIVNVKYSTANIMQNNAQQGTCIEILVYGTAVFR